MSRQKTFDQMLNEHSESDTQLRPELFEPNRVIRARIILEPMPEQEHVRITARTDDNQLLWGKMYSPASAKTHPVAVAIYDALIAAANSCLPTRVSPATLDQHTEALTLVGLLKSRLGKIEKDLRRKKVSEKTMKRGASRLPDLRDALTLIDMWETNESKSEEADE